TVRLTQAGNAFQVPMEQMRQEINSLLTGQITEDSMIAKRLGFDNKSVKAMIANGTLIAEVVKRTEAYSKAAEAQSNTLKGKLINTAEIIVSTISRALDPLGSKATGILDQIFGFFSTRGDAIVEFSHRVILAIEKIVGKIRDWIIAHKDLLEEIASWALVVAGAISVWSLLAGAITALTSPIGLTIVAVVALAVAWEKLRKYSEIEVGGRPIAAYVRATFAAITTAIKVELVVQYALIRQVIDNVVGLVKVGIAGFTLMVAVARVIGQAFVAIPKAIIGAFVEIFEPVTRIVKLVFGVIGAFIGMVIDGVTLAHQPIIRFFSVIFGVVKNAFSGFIEFVGKVYNGIKAAHETLANFLVTIFRTAGGAISDFLQPVFRIIGRVADVALAPLRYILNIIASIPARIASGIPGLADLQKAVKDFAASFGNIRFDAWANAKADIEKLTKDGKTNINAALASKGPLPGVRDLVKDAWSSASDWLKGALPELAKIGDAAADAITGRAKKTAPKARDPKLQKIEDDYLEWAAEFKTKADATGDPLSETIAGIVAQREKAIEKLGDFARKLGQGIITSPAFGQVAANIDKFFGDKIL
ncbi:MAG TPA: hypothetical protein VN181_08125, partial [Thermoanaerobaculia bacterium]|nr:hypothetical protein [Thermoanaerobaculia bacterium]